MKLTKEQIEEAIKALELKEPLGTEEFHKIEIYLGNKEKNKRK